MPELPEVQTVVNYIRDDLIGDTIIGIEPLWGKVLDNFSKSLFNKNHNFLIVDVRRRAKLIIIETTDKIIAVHLRMTGKLFIKENKIISKHCRAIFLLKSGKQIVFEDIRKFGRIYAYDNMKIIDSKHGVEPLGQRFTIKFLYEGLRNRKRNIKYLLLDQKFIAGLGNIYTDECLWISKIHPKSISSKIPEKNIHKLFESIKTVLLESLESMGTTIINYSFVNGRSGQYSDQLRVFGRTNKPCKICDYKIKKIRVAGRGTHFCQKCQKKYT
tara:strand:- start:2154 stop:2966 length:813 start_codon:yes stop_codon:yes gene_type:complete